MTKPAKGARHCCPFCKHEWTQRGETPPRACPKCKRLMKRSTPRECKRCGWVWETKRSRLPNICPHCKSPHWATAKRSGLLSVRAADIRLPGGHRPNLPTECAYISSDLQKDFVRTIKRQGRMEELQRMNPAERLAEFAKWHRANRKAKKPR